MNTKSAMLFDMDGVVIDSHAVAYNLLCASAQKFVPDISINLIKSWGSLSSRQFWLKIKQDFGVQTDLDTLVRSYSDDEEIEMYRGMRPIEGLERVLSQVREVGIKTALVTSASQKRMGAVLELFDLSSSFDATVCDDEVLASKPDPQIYLRAAEKLKVNPSGCVVIEDSKNGVLSAKSAGMRCIGFIGSPHVSEDLSSADTVIRGFREFDLRYLSNSLL